ncbi:hypothetical protein M758_1G160500 [Ceratodon purpureus]|nr:hypothetical protein M758_1G160500 [Ceratodon purpureus]
MSKQEFELHPLTVKLHKTRVYPYKDPSKPRAADFYDSEVNINWADCDRPQPDESETFANNPQWIKDHDRRDYRNRRIEQILKYVCVRNKDEPFDLYIERAYCDAHVALKAHGKGHYGNDYPTLLDRWVFRFVKGFKLLSRLKGTKWDPYDEQMLTKLVREECEILSKQNEVFVDPYEKCRKVKRAWEPVEPDNYPPSAANKPKIVFDD